MDNYCTNCGQQLEKNHENCNICGESLENTDIKLLTQIEEIKENKIKQTKEQSNRKNSKLNWKWIITSGIIIFISTFLVMSILSIPLIYFKGAKVFDESFNLYYYYSISSMALGAFLGGLISAYYSPGITIKEPAISAAFIMTGLAIFDLNIVSILSSWIGPYLAALFGAKVGEYFQARKSKKS